MWPRRNKPTALDSMPDYIDINPAARAEILAGSPMIYDDERVPSQDGATPPRFTREEERTSALERAAFSAKLTERLDGGITHDRSISEGLAVAWANTETEREQLRVSTEAQRDELRQMEVHVSCTVAAKRKFVSLWGKPVMVAGDAFTITQTQYLAGVPLWMAAFSGLSAGVGLVAVGSKFGQEAMYAQHRLDRGEMPEGVPGFLRPLFDGPGQSEAKRRDTWLVISLLTAAIVFAAFIGIGLSVGDGFGMAMASGLFAAMTVVGSAALEAYGANEAAEIHADRVASLHAAQQRYDELVAIGIEQAQARERAESGLIAAQHEANAAALTTGTSGRTYDNPRIFGYLSHVTERQSLPSIGELRDLARIDAVPAAGGVAPPELIPSAPATSDGGPEVAEASESSEVEPNVISLTDTVDFIADDVLAGQNGNGHRGEPEVN